MENKKLKKGLPHIIAIILFLGMSIIYFAPAVFDNKELLQGDIMQSAAWGKDLMDYHQQTGEYAFWSNSMFSGMPANYTFMPPMFNLFGAVDYLRHYVFPPNTLLIFLYLIGFYIFLISIGCKPWLSIVGAIAYTFASYNIIIIGAGHVHKALVMSTMAPIIGGIILCYRKKYLSGAIITLISTGINIFWSHQQISYYLLIIILILAIVYLIYAIREKTLKDYFKSSAVLVAVALLAIAPALGKLISTADYTKETMRGGAVLQNDAQGKKESSGLDMDYAFAWSYGKGETMTLLIPNFYGGGSKNTIPDDSETFTLIRKAGYGAKDAAHVAASYLYWGDQPGTDGPVYMGAIICFLFVLGLMIVKGPEKWWILIATVVGIVMSWGRHFPAINEFLFYHLPLYNKFRTPSMALAIAEVTMAALAILALKEIFDHKGNRKIFLKPVYFAAGITGGLCLIFALFGGALTGFSRMGEAEMQSQNPQLLAALISDRKSMLASDSWRSIVFIILAMGALWLYIRNSFKTSYIIAIIGVLIFIDLWTVDKRYLNYDSFVPKQKALFTPTEADQQILQDKDPHYRVLNLTASTFNDAGTSYFHKSIGGYNPAKLRRYQDVIDYHFARTPNMNVLNMLNAKYVILPTQQRQQQAQINPNALGNVWFVNELKWVDSPDEEILALKDFDPAQTAFIDKEWQTTLKGWESLQHDVDSTASIRMTDYANPGNIFYESSSAMPRLAVFSEVFYKTWHAYIDGVEAPLVRVNYILRGLPIPAGKHAIEFRCIDDVYLRGAKISIIASIFTGLILLCLFGYAIWDSRKMSLKQAEKKKH